MFPAIGFSTAQKRLLSSLSVLAATNGSLALSSVPGGFGDLKVESWLYDSAESVNMQSFTTDETIDVFILASSDENAEGQLFLFFFFLFSIGKRKTVLYRHVL